MTDVSILGTGLMGSAIARALLRQGMSVTVWNRTPDKAEALRVDGATVAATATEALRASPVSVFVIFSYDNVREIVETALVDGPVGQIVNLVTGKPSDGTDLATWASDRGLEVIDGAILAYPDGIGEADSVLVYAGNAALWSERRDLLTLLGGASTYLGDDMALANTMDHVVLNFVTTTQTALFETLAYAQRAGLDVAVASAFLEQFVPMIGAYLKYAQPMLASGDFSTAEATIDTWAMSSQSLAESARAVGLPGRAIHAAAETILAAQAAGLGSYDLAAVFTSELDQA